MKLGVPRESASGETRVSATPDTVKKLCSLGLEVMVERGAGESAAFSDTDFTTAGAQLCDARDAFGADLVTKVRRPNEQEIAGLREGALLVGLLEPRDDDGTLARLAEAKVDALAMEMIPRISRAQSMDVLSSQANIAGYRAVLEAATHYGRFLPMMMTAAGSARPAKLIVLGAGVAGLQAIATARRLGAEVESFDVRPEVKEQVESLGAKFIDLDIGESGAGEGGYAKELSAEAKQRQQDALTAYLAKANIIITTALIPGRPAPVLVTEAGVANMRAGTVIIDMAAAAGGNCPLTRAEQVIGHNGVTIVGHTNYPAMVPADASAFYARNLLNLITLMVESSEEGVGLKPFEEDEITRESMVVHNAEVAV